MNTRKSAASWNRTDDYDFRMEKSFIVRIGPPPRAAFWRAATTPVIIYASTLRQGRRTHGRVWEEVCLGAFSPDYPRKRIRAVENPYGKMTHARRRYTAKKKRSGAMFTIGAFRLFRARWEEKRVV